MSRRSRFWKLLSSCSEFASTRKLGGTFKKKKKNHSLKVKPFVEIWKEMRRWSKFSPTSVFSPAVHSEQSLQKLPLQPQTQQTCGPVVFSSLHVSSKAAKWTTAHRFHNMQVAFSKQSCCSAFWIQSECTCFNPRDCVKQKKERNDFSSAHNEPSMCITFASKPVSLKVFACAAEQAWWINFSHWCRSVMFIHLPDMQWCRRIHHLLSEEKTKRSSVALIIPPKKLLLHPQKWLFALTLIHSEGSSPVASL